MTPSSSRRSRQASRPATGPMAPATSGATCWTWSVKKRPGDRCSEEGLACGLHRIERLMRINALRARPKRRGKPKDDGERSVIADNILDRDFQADRPNQKWPADFTYIWTAEGWLYVAVVLDLYLPACRRLVHEGRTGRIAGHGCADDGGLAARQGHAPASSLGPGLAIHKRAVSAASGRQRHHLLDEPGRERLGQFRDGELLLVAEDRTDQPQGLRTRDEARADVFDYIERFYNPRRRHRNSGYLSPMELEARAMLA
jgi:putative transposase